MSGTLTSVITFDDDVFSYDDDHGYSYETFAVNGTFEPAVVVEALDSIAQPRLMLVDDDGILHADFDAIQAADVMSAANYVSDAQVTARGVEVYIDCKGAIEDVVAAAYRRVLTEVLDQAVGDAHVAAVRYGEA